MPIPTLAPVDKLEDLELCEVLEDAGTVVEELEEVLEACEVAVPDVGLCIAVEPEV
jgi:hypothetical protein